MTSRTRELTDSALLVSMLILLALAPRYLPLWGLGMALILLQPLPVSLATHRYRAGRALLVSVVAGVTLLAVIDPLSALTEAIFMCAVGVPIGWAMRRHWPWWSGGTAASAGAALFLIANAALLHLLFGEDVLWEPSRALVQTGFSVLHRLQHFLPGWLVQLGVQIGTFLESHLWLVAVGQVTAGAVLLGSGCYIVGRWVIPRVVRATG